MLKIWGVCVAAITLMSISGCNTLMPYSISVTEFNEGPIQQPAAITISDPQIYSRESLINDRLEEIKLLDDLLEASRDPLFLKNFSEPQILRNLEAVSAVIARAHVAMDPKLSKNIKTENADASNQPSDDPYASVKPDSTN